MYANFTQRGNTIYALVDKWPGDTRRTMVSFYQPPSVISRRLRTKVKSAKLLVSGKPAVPQMISSCESPISSAAPDAPATVIVLECDGEPVMDRDYVRKNRPRFKAGVSYT
jgi:hypothetical protein